MEKYDTDLRETLSQEELFDATYLRMQNLFKDNFFGIEEVITAFTLPKQRSLAAHIAIRGEMQKIKKMLHAKCSEPDVAFFLDNATEKTYPIQDWMLVLFIPSIIHQGVKHPVTMEYIVNTMKTSLYKSGKGSLLSRDSRWILQECFYRSEKIPAYRWDIVTKNCISGTHRRDPKDQARILKNYAAPRGINASLIRQRTPLDTLYTYLVMLNARDTKILPGEFDEVAYGKSEEESVFVGMSSLGGLKFHSASERYRHAHATGRTLTR